MTIKIPEERSQRYYMETQRKGNITEVETMLAFLKLGYAVLIPYGCSERYDYIVDFNGRFIRIQSKHSTKLSHGKGFCFDIRSHHYETGKVVHDQYTDDEIDYFATSYDGKCYLVPVGAYKSQVKLRLIPSKDNRGIPCTWAKDFELEKVIKKLEMEQKDER